jgi:hypothetical protein
MSRMIRGAARSALVVSVVLMLGVAGCFGDKTGGGSGGAKTSSSRGGGKKVSEADAARLEEARKAAEDAERKLSNLRLERLELEGGGQQ